MGFLESLLQKLSERDELVMQAGRVGDANEVIRMGILCAKLGLTEKDLQPMAETYYLMRVPTGLDAEQWILAQQYLVRAIGAASRGKRD